jgi:hypothetical protein
VQTCQLQWTSDDHSVITSAKSNIMTAVIRIAPPNSQASPVYHIIVGSPSLIDAATSKRASFGVRGTAEHPPERVLAVAGGFWFGGGEAEGSGCVVAALRP